MNEFSIEAFLQGGKMEITTNRLHNSWWTCRPMSDGGTYYYDRHQQLEVLFNASYDRDMPEDTEKWWEIVTEVWQRTEHPRNQVEAWTEIFAENPGQNAATLEWLKKPKTLYRGYLNTLPDYAWSWTTDREKALWFANRYGNTNSAIKQIHSSELDPNQVLCVMEDYESEVLLHCRTAANRLNYSDEEEFMMETA